MFARSLYALLRTSAGIETSGLLALTIDPSLHKYSPDRTRRLFVEVEDKMRRLPGAMSSSGAADVILANDIWQNTVHVEGYHPAKGEDMNPGFNQVLPGFFQTMGARVIAGRDFTERDTLGAPKLVIVGVAQDMKGGNA